MCVGQMINLSQTIYDYISRMFEYNPLEMGHFDNKFQSFIYNPFTHLSNDEHTLQNYENILKTYFLVTDSRIITNNRLIIIVTKYTISKGLVNRALQKYQKSLKKCLLNTTCTVIYVACRNQQNCNLLIKMLKHAKPCFA